MSTLPLADPTHSDARIARLHAAYHEYDADGLHDAWVYYLAAISRSQGSRIGTSEEMVLFAAFTGIIAIAARTRLRLDTAINVAVFNLQRGKETARPNF